MPIGTISEKPGEVRRLALNLAQRFMPGLVDQQKSIDSKK